MIIEFYDDGCQVVGRLKPEADNYWDACLEGHAHLARGTYLGATDFQVEESSASVPVAGSVDKV